jgi:hypothetical protein
MCCTDDRQPHAPMRAGLVGGPGPARAAARSGGPSCLSWAAVHAGARPARRAPGLDSPGGDTLGFMARASLTRVVALDLGLHRVIERGTACRCNGGPFAFDVRQRRAGGWRFVKQGRQTGGIKRWKVPTESAARSLTGLNGPVQWSSRSHASHVYRAVPPPLLLSVGLSGSVTRVPCRLPWVETQVPWNFVIQSSACTTCRGPARVHSPDLS